MVDTNSRNKTDKSIAVITMRDMNLAEDRTTRPVEVPTMAMRLKTAAPPRPSLMVIAGMDMGNVFTIGDDPVFVGRATSCDLKIQDDSISRQHARIEKLSGGYIRITDLESTNGTYSNGKIIKTITLAPGEKILLGHNTVIKYLLQDDIDLKYQRELYESSTRDGLTGIFNRRYLMQKLTTDLSFARRHRLPFSLLLFDIDFFKRVNDTYGHLVGDQVLMSIARIVQSTIRTEDMLGRYGGEEYNNDAQGTDAAGAKVLADRVRDAIEREPALAVTERGDFVRVTVSVGAITLAPGAILDAPGLLSSADANLYQAKYNGRNSLVATEISAATSDRNLRRIPFPSRNS